MTCVRVRARERARAHVGISFPTWHESVQRAGTIIFNDAEDLRPGLGDGMSGPPPGMRLFIPQGPFEHQ